MDLNFPEKSNEIFLGTHSDPLLGEWDEQRTQNLRSSKSRKNIENYRPGIVLPFRIAFESLTFQKQVQEFRQWMVAWKVASSWKGFSFMSFVPEFDVFWKMCYQMENFCREALVMTTCNFSENIEFWNDQDTMVRKFLRFFYISNFRLGVLD